jgi:hypothetical protein
MCFREDPRVRHGAGSRETASEIRNSRRHGVPCFHRTHQHGVSHGCAAGPRAKAACRRSGMAPGRAAPPSGIWPVGKSTGTPCLRGWAAPHPGLAVPRASGRADTRGHAAGLVDTNDHAPGCAIGWKAGGAAAPTPSGGLRCRNRVAAPLSLHLAAWGGRAVAAGRAAPPSPGPSATRGRPPVEDGVGWCGRPAPVWWERPPSPGSSATRGQPPVEEEAGGGRDAYSTAWRRRRRREVGARTPPVGGADLCIWRRSGCCSLAVREGGEREKKRDSNNFETEELRVGRFGLAPRPRQDHAPCGLDRLVAGWFGGTRPAG